MILFLLIFSLRGTNLSNQIHDSSYWRHSRSERGCDTYNDDDDWDDDVYCDDDDYGDDIDSDKDGGLELQTSMMIALIIVSL